MGGASKLQKFEVGSEQARNHTVVPINASLIIPSLNAPSYTKS